MTPLPAPVARYRELVRASSDLKVETVAIEATATMRRPGLPPIPLEIGMAHRLGYSFVHDIRIGRGRLSFRFGLDAYVDGHGLMKIGRSLRSGVAFDQGALIALWGEAVGFPSAWEERDDVRWEPIDDLRARLVVSGPEEDIPITIGFDASTGCPAFCVADRYKSDGPKVRWTGRTSSWRRFDRGVLAPGRFTAQWADESRPWIDIRTHSLAVNATIDDALRIGLDALRAAEARRPTAGRAATR